MAISPEKQINFNSQEWFIIKTVLAQMKEQKIGLLISADSHDKSNQIRGSLALIQQILAWETAASSKQGGL